MPQDRISRLIEAYFNRPQREYLFVLSSIKGQGGLNQDEIESIKARLPYVHASAIIRQMGSITLKSTT